MQFFYHLEDKMFSFSDFNLVDLNRQSTMQSFLCPIKRWDLSLYALYKRKFNCYALLLL